MTCRLQVIRIFRLIILIVSLLAAPIGASGLSHSLASEAENHIGCPHETPNLDKFRPVHCAICILCVIDREVLLSLGINLPVRQLSLPIPEKGEGIEHQPLKRPPRSAG